MSQHHKLKNKTTEGTEYCCPSDSFTEDTEVAFGGHLESGVEVLTFAILTLAEVDYDFTGFDSIGDIEGLRPQ
jgi:hypothetical protein